MADIFISYASSDRPKAESISKILASQGYSVWWDRVIPPGQVFDDVIQKSLDAARCVIVLWSEASVSSNWVKTEAAEAAQRGILVPALIKDVRPPIEFKRIQAANLVQWDSDPEHPEFQNLLASVERLVRGAGTGASAVAHADAPRAFVANNPDRPLAKYAVAVGFLILVGAGAWYWRHSGSPKPEIQANKPMQTQPAASTQRDAATQPAGLPANAKDRAPTSVKRVNLIAKENGGQLLAAPDKVWAKAITDYDDMQGWYGAGEAVYGFKDQGRATFDTFSILITQTNGANVKDFELFAGSDTPTGPFESIGQFTTQNVRLMESPYQEFKFPPVTARYVKFKVLTDHRGNKGDAGLFKFKLFGTLG